jgi:hypothetical protein
MGERIGTAASQFGNTVASDLNPMGLVHSVLHPIDTLKASFGPGAWVTPEEAAKNQMPIPELLGHAAAIVGGASVPGLIGKGMRGTAEPLAESALGVKPIQRAYHRSPGAAALDETTGVRPATIAQQARSRLGDINTQLENVVGKSNAPADLGPARGVLNSAEATAREGNAAKTVNQLKPMQKHLVDPLPGFNGAMTQPTAPMVAKPSGVLGPNGQPLTTMVPGQAPPATISAIQNPRALLNLKRGFGDEFVHNWNPETMKGVTNTAAQTYHTLADTLHKAVPEATELDKRASSLIPVAERAESIDRGPGMGQRTMGRISAHTGAGLGTGIGYLTGGLPGAVAGAVIPEVLSEPSVKMAIARMLNAGSKGLKSAPARTAGRAIPLVNAVRGEQQ